MMKKRKAEASGLDDVERSLHTSFCAAANSISQLYTQAHQQHKIAFQAGQKHGLEKLCEWIQRQHQFGVTPSTPDIWSYLKNELNSMSQAEVAVAQVQYLPIAPQILQQVPHTPFGREPLSQNQERFPLPTGFTEGFSTG